MNKAETRAELVELHLPIPGNERTVMIAVDRALVRSVNTHKLTLVGGVGPLHVAIDRYPSAAKDEGEECYVRVLDLVAEEERWCVLAHSAAQDHRSDAQVIRWAEGGKSFVVDLADRPSLLVELGEGGELAVGAIVEQGQMN